MDEEFRAGHSSAASHLFVDGADLNSSIEVFQISEQCLPDLQIKLIAGGPITPKQDPSKPRPKPKPKPKPKPAPDQKPDKKNPAKKKKR